MARAGTAGGAPRRGVTAAHYERRPTTARGVAVPDGRTRWALRELVVLHEIAHHLCDAEPPHGPEFVATFCDLAGRRDGPGGRACTSGGVRERRCEITGIARVAEPDPKALDEDALLNRVLNTEDDALMAAREAADAAGMPAIEVSAQHGKLL